MQTSNTSSTGRQVAGSSPYIDNAGQLQGEFKSKHSNGKMQAHCRYVNGNPGGECKYWTDDGKLSDHSIYAGGVLHGESRACKSNGEQRNHSFYVNGIVITGEVRALVVDISALTSEEKILIKLRFGIDCLPELV